MPCMTMLVGKRATYDGSTIIARNEDEASGKFTPKRMHVMLPQDQPTSYHSVLAHLDIDLSGLTPQRYTSVPDALSGNGIWAASGINESDVAMTATETIILNTRVLGADPLVMAQPAVGEPGEEGYRAAIPGGLSEEDFLTLVLPYISTAREGVLRVGELLARYGTSEANGMAISDVNEIWWLETVGGHHWIARRVPDDCYVAMPNQLGIDAFDLADAEGAGREHLCSPDLRAWMEAHHLDLTIRTEGEPTDVFNPREAFGTAGDVDHVYNTPRAWDVQRLLSPHACRWEGPGAECGPTSDDLPWCRRPERLLTIEDMKRVLSLHFQGTPYDCYGDEGTEATRGAYRPIGINRTNELSVLQLRPHAPEPCRAVQWMAYGCNVFNALVPLYANVRTMPAYLADTTAQVTTDNLYWTNRLVAALADAHYNACLPYIESYQETVGALGHALLASTDSAVKRASTDRATSCKLLEEANDRMAADLRRETDALLDQVLYTASVGMRNAFARSDR